MNFDVQREQHRGFLEPVVVDTTPCGFGFHMHGTQLLFDLNLSGLGQCFSFSCFVCSVSSSVGSPVCIRARLVVGWVGGWMGGWLTGRGEKHAVRARSISNVGSIRHQQRGASSQQLLQLRGVGTVVRKSRSDVSRQTTMSRPRQQCVGSWLCFVTDLQ